MYDPSITPVSDQHFSLGSEASNNPQWWLGEPIWNTVMKNGKKAATFFWPGSEVKIQGMLPNYYEKYNKSVSFEDRVKKVVEWIEMPSDKRPHLINLYFSQPDAAGHKYGPFSQHVNDQLLVVDSMIDKLMNRLFDSGLSQCINIVMVSDHGMAKITRNITLATYYNRLGNPDTTMVFNGPVGRVVSLPGGPRPDDIVLNLRCNKGFRVYLRQNAPKRLHYTKSSRIGDVIIDSDEGYYITRDTGYAKKGSHGHDYRDRGMHALFLAYGPAFKRGYTGLPFQNIELYNLFADLMQLKTRAVTDGTRSSLDHLLRNPASPTLPDTFEIDSCDVNLDNLSPCGPCTTGNRQSEACPLPANSLVRFNREQSASISGCWTKSCPYNTVYDKNIFQSRLVVGMIHPMHKVVVNPPLCNIIDTTYTQCSKLQQMYQYQLKPANAQFYPLIQFDDQEPSTISTNFYVTSPMLNSFYNGAWSLLQDLTVSYASRYGSLIIYSGPVFDYDLDDMADNKTVITNYTVGSSGVPLATHFYSILVRCDSMWNKGGVCVDGGSLHVLSFILPHKSNISNCQDASSYLFMHTARVNDIQRLTRFVFFNDQNVYDSTNAIRLRTHVNDKLWVI